jgi:hypothetical protein
MATTITPSTAVPYNSYANPQTNTIQLDADAFLMKRDFLKAVDTSWDDKDFISFLELTNSRLVQASKFYHYEQGLLFRAPYIAAVSGTATAASASFTLTAASYTNDGQADRGPLKVTDIVNLIGDIYGRISAVSGSGISTVYTVTRRSGTTEDIGAAITLHAGSSNPIAVQFDAHSEGSNFPGSGMTTPATRFTGGFQTIKSYESITGDADSILRDITIDGQAYQFRVQTAQALKRHRIKQNMAYMLSPEGSFDDNGKPVPLSASLRGKLKTIGNKLLYDGTTGFVLSDLDKLCTQIKLLTGDKEVHWFIGPDLRAQVEGLLRTFTVNGGISYNSFGMGDNKMRAIDLGFGSFCYHDITFHMQEFRLHSQLTGLSWQTYGKEGYILPASQMSVTRSNEKGGVETVSLNALTLCYRTDSDGNNRRFREVQRDINVTFNDSKEKGLMTQEGLQYVGARKGWFVAPQ